MYLDISDGSTTQILSGSGAIVGCTYFPLAPERTESGEYNDVTESAEVILRGTSADIRSAVNDIETLLIQAHRKQTTGQGSRIYVNYKPVASDSTWRSEVLGGRLSWSDDPALRRLKDATPTVRVFVTWRRRHYWESAETERSITNTGYTPRTGGVPILNHDDSATGHDNWVSVSASALSSVAPLGVRLTLQNSTGSNQTWPRMYVAVSDMAPITLEGEARVSGGTLTGDSGASNGQYLGVTLTSGSSVNFDWTLSQSAISAAAGRYMRLFCVLFSAGSSGTTALPSLHDGSGNFLWRGAPVDLPTTAGIADLGIVPLPPGGVPLATAAALTLRLALTGSGSWGIDFMQMVPAADVQGVFCLAPIQSNGFIVLDGIEQRVYALSSSSQYQAHAGTVGRFPTLRPNADHYVSVLAARSGSFSINDTFTVRLYTRQRRLVV